MWRRASVLLPFAAAAFLVVVCIPLLGRQASDAQRNSRAVLVPPPPARLPTLLTTQPLERPQGAGDGADQAVEQSVFSSEHAGQRQPLPLRGDGVHHSDQFEGGNNPQGDEEPVPDKHNEQLEKRRHFETDEKWQQQDETLPVGLTPQVEAQQGPNVPNPAALDETVSAPEHSLQNEVAPLTELAESLHNFEPVEPLQDRPDSIASSAQAPLLAGGLPEHQSLQRDHGQQLTDPQPTVQDNQQDKLQPVTVDHNHAGLPEQNDPPHPLTAALYPESKSTPKDFHLHDAAPARDVDQPLSEVDQGLTLHGNNLGHQPLSDGNPALGSMDAPGLPPPLDNPLEGNDPLVERVPLDPDQGSLMRSDEVHHQEQPPRDAEQPTSDSEHKSVASGDSATHERVVPLQGAEDQPASHFSPPGQPVARDPPKDLEEAISRPAGQQALAPAAEWAPPTYDSALCHAVRKGRHHIPSCFRDKPKRVLPLLITSTGRSGTKFMSKVLVKLGYDMSHDNDKAIGRHGAVSWPLAAGNPQPKWGTKLASTERFAVIIHQWRDPLQSIPSRAALIHPVVDGFVEHHTGDLRKTRLPSAFRRNNLAVAMLHFFTWHRFIDAQAPEMQFKLEDVNSELVLKILECGRLRGAINPTAAQISQVIDELDKSTNTAHVQEHDDLTWRELFNVHAGLAKATMQLAMEHGYTYKEKLAEMPTEGKLDSVFPYPKSTDRTRT